MNWTKEFIDWLKQGDEDANTYLDIPWDVNTAKDGHLDVIEAYHPKMPFSIRITMSKHYASMSIDMAYPTANLDLGYRLEIYSKLLEMNAMFNLIKACVKEEDKGIILMVDLDLECVNRIEFNDALTLLIVGCHYVVEMLGIEERVSNYMREQTTIITNNKIASGESREQIMDYLLHRVGLDEVFAGEFLSSLK